MSDFFSSFLSLASDLAGVSSAAKGTGVGAVKPAGNESAATAANRNVRIRRFPNRLAADWPSAAGGQVKPVIGFGFRLRGQGQRSYLVELPKADSGDFGKGWDADLEMLPLRGSCREA